MCWIRKALLFCIALFLLSCSSQPPPVNVVLICVDTLRPDHLGCYGYSRNTSPHMDRLARRGTLFRTAVSTTTWTLPAHVALFTSLYDSVHGVKTGEIRMDEARTTLAEVFRRQGYATAAIISAPYLNQSYGFGKGFDHYVDLTDEQIPVERMFQDEITTKKEFEEIKAVKDSAHRAAPLSITSPRVTQSAINWLKNTDKPFFIFVHYFDVHYDFIPPGKYATLFDTEYKGTMTGRNFNKNPAVRQGMPEEDLQHIIALYDGEIAHTDHHIGNLLNFLDSHYSEKKTLVVLTSDHGEEFFDHGDKAHHRNLFEATLRIPLLFSLPGTISAGKEISQLVRIIDIAPTVLNLAGLNPHREMMGRSLTALLNGSVPASVPPAFCELEIEKAKDLFALRGENWKIIYDKKNDHWAYFSMKGGSGESKTTFSTPPLKLKRRLLNAIRRHKKRGEALPGTTAKRKVSFSEGLLRKLKELGYIEETD